MTTHPEGLTRPEWDCTDPMLCSYKTTVRGRVYTAQRTYCDTVSVWSGGKKIGTAPNPATWREDAMEIAMKHRAKVK